MGVGDGRSALSEAPGPGERILRVALDTGEPAVAASALIFAACPG